MNQVKTLILGAGIGGLATGAELLKMNESDFLIVDSAPSLPLNLGNGVHYLHDTDLDLPFQLDFKHITSTEEIWNPRKDEWKKTAHIPEMMEYSMKVMGVRHPSSISDPGSRAWKTYVPLSNDMNDLLKAYETFIGDRFVFGCKLMRCDTLGKTATIEDNFGVPHLIKYERLVSTLPLPYLCKACGVTSEANFVQKPIYITNYKSENIVPNWLVSIYISDLKFPPYRITILNGIVSMESLTPMTEHEESVVKYHLERYFDYDLKSASRHSWPSGRIWGLDKDVRDALVATFGVFGISLVGRYGRWDGKLEMATTVRQAQEIVREITL
jgi:hypothetical protein